MAATNTKHVAPVEICSDVFIGRESEGVGGSWRELEGLSGIMRRRPAAEVRAGGGGGEGGQGGRRKRHGRRMGEREELGGKRGRGVWGVGGGGRGGIALNRYGDHAIATNLRRDYS